MTVVFALGLSKALIRPFPIFSAFVPVESVLCSRVATAVSVRLGRSLIETVVSMAAVQLTRSFIFGGSGLAQQQQYCKQLWLAWSCSCGTGCQP